MAATFPFLTHDSSLSETRPLGPQAVSSTALNKSKGLLDITGVFRGRELTRKDRRLSCRIAPVDRLLGGGIVRGRVSEIIGPSGAGLTSIAAAFAASLTARGEVAAWIDVTGSFDPASIQAAGVDLARMLWVALPADRDRPSPFDPERPRRAPRSATTLALKAAEWILAAGGFGLIVLDYTAMPNSNRRTIPFSQSAALRLAHHTERSGAAMLVLASQRMCGTFAALSLTLTRHRACFSRADTDSPTLFDGLTVEARVARNKLGGSGATAVWSALADPPLMPSQVTAPPQSSPLSSVTRTAPALRRRAAAR
jgi:hypothetical protein